MAELCSFFFFSGSTFSARALDGSQDIIRNIPVESKQMTDYFFRRVQAMSQEALFWANGRESRKKSLGKKVPRKMIF